MRRKLYFNFKFSIILIFSLLIASYIVGASSYPPRCYFDSTADCLDFNHNLNGQTANVEIRLRMNIDFNNVNLEISNCKLIDKKTDGDTFDFKYTCSSKASDYGYVRGGFEFKPSMKLFDNGNFISEGRLLILRIKPPLKIKFQILANEFFSKLMSPVMGILIIIGFALFQYRDRENIKSNKPPVYWLWNDFLKPTKIKIFLFLIFILFALFFFNIQILSLKYKFQFYVYSCLLIFIYEGLKKNKPKQTQQYPS